VQAELADGDPATSEGLKVEGSDDAASLEVGDRVRLRGTVREVAFEGSRSVTTLVEVSSCEVRASGQPLPEPVSPIAFGAASRAIVEADFAWPALARRQIELYAALLGWL